MKSNPNKTRAAIAGSAELFRLDFPLDFARELAGLVATLAGSGATLAGSVAMLATSPAKLAISGATRSRGGSGSV